MTNSITYKETPKENNIWVAWILFIGLAVLGLIGIIVGLFVPEFYTSNTLSILFFPCSLTSLVLAIIDKVKHKEHSKVLVVLSAILFTFSLLFYVVYIAYTLITIHALAESGFLG